MILNKKNCKFGATDLLLLLAGVLFAVGIRFWFPVCAGMENSAAVMSCHWAGEALKAASVLTAALCAVHLFTPDEKMKAGESVALAGLGVFIMLLPERIVALCVMPGMACRAKTMPAALISGALILLLSLADLIFWLTRDAAKKHHRNV